MIKYCIENLVANTILSLHYHKPFFTDAEQIPARTPVSSPPADGVDESQFNFDDQQVINLCVVSYFFTRPLSLSWLLQREVKEEGGGGVTIKIEMIIMLAGILIFQIEIFSACHEM